MALTIRQAPQFRRDIKRLQRQRIDLAPLKTAMTTLAIPEPLADVTATTL